MIVNFLLLLSAFWYRCRTRFLPSLLPMVVLAVLQWLPNQTWAAEMPSNGTWYYRLGGGAPLLSVRPTNNTIRIPLRFSLDFSLGRSCGNFDPMVALRSSFQELRNLPEQAETAVMGAASAAVAALPSYLLQRINPGLYELYQSWRKKFEELIQIAFKSCEDMQRDIAAGKNPYEEWVQLSVGDDWKAAMGTDGLSITTEKREIEARRGQNGVTWFGGRAGGRNQQPVRVISDVTAAGYSALISGNTTGGDSAPADSPLARMWSTSDEARNFATEVLGDIEIVTCDTATAGCQTPRTLAAHGLMPRLTREGTNVTTALGDLLGADVRNLQPTDLQTVAAPNLEIGPQVLQRLQRLNDPARSILAGRLAGEVATQRTIERALMLRRVLLAGRKAPEIAANDPAKREIDRALAELEREIDSFRYEAEVRRLFVGETAISALSRDVEADRGATPSVPHIPAVDPDRNTVTQ